MSKVRRDSSTRRFPIDCVARYTGLMKEQRPPLTRKRRQICRTDGRLLLMLDPGVKLSLGLHDNLVLHPGVACAAVLVAHAAVHAWLVQRHVDRVVLVRTGICVDLSLEAGVQKL
jgi:hypothetical protein